MTKKSNLATLIVLEGCDGAGKTTLAENMKTIILRDNENTRVEIVHYGPPDTSISVVDTYMEPLRKLTREQVGNESLVVICDRFAVGEIVYGEILRNEDRTVPDDFTRIMSECATIFDRRHFWYVRPELDVIKKRFGDRGDDLITTEMVERIYVRYDELLLGHSPWGIITEHDQNSFAEKATEQ